MLVLSTAAAFTLTTAAAVAVLGASAGRRQVVRAGGWWIPLFLKAAAVASIGAAAGTLATDYVAWRDLDAQIEQIVRQGTVQREERRTGLTVYEFVPAASGGYWSTLYRYDFEVVWEAVAAAGALGGLVGGLFALVVARVTMRVRQKPPGFPVGT